MLTVHLAGIMYFQGCDNDMKRVLVPNGTMGYDDIPPHYASLWVEQDQFEAEDWFDGHVHQHDVKVQSAAGKKFVTIREYRIPEKAELTFPDENEESPSFVNLPQVLNKLEDLAPGFSLDSSPDVIATIPVRGGVLEAFDFMQFAVVRWTIARNTSLQISATTSSETKWVTLKAPSDGGDSEVVFGNTSDLIKKSAGLAGGVAADPDDEHFKLYAKLRAGRKRDDMQWKVVKRKMGQLPHHHDYLTGVRSGFEISGVGCEGTCC